MSIESKIPTEEELEHARNTLELTADEELTAGTVAKKYVHLGTKAMNDEERRAALEHAKMTLM